MRTGQTQHDNGDQATTSRIGDMLIEAELVTPDDVERALERQRATGRRLGETLFEVGAISSFDLARVLADRQGIEFVDLDKTPPEDDALLRVPTDLARRYGAIALSVEGEDLRVALANPTDVYALDDLESTTGMSVEAVMADPAQLLVALSRLDGAAEAPLNAELATHADPMNRPRREPGVATEEAANLVMAELRRLELAYGAVQGAESTTWSVDGDAMPLSRYLLTFVGPEAGSWAGDAKEMCLDLYLLAFRNVAVFLSDPRLDSGAHAFTDEWPPADDATNNAVARLSQQERALGRRLAGPATNAPMRAVGEDALETMRADMSRVLQAFVDALRPECRSWFAIGKLELPD